MMYIIFAFLIILCISYRFYKHFFPPPNINPHGKYVLISGCDSGFGHGLAIELDKQGFNVLAGVLLPNSVDSLKSKLSSNATVFRLDITKQEDIDAAFELVQNKTNTLHALVNNAGIVESGYIDWITIDTMRKIMDVNFFGHVAMTKKFLPLLINKRHSRVINMSSMCGFLALPGSSAYCASKYALESFSDCLRREMSPWNLYVSIIEPGTMKTAMTDGVEQSLKNVWLRLPSDIKERWGHQFFKDNLEFVINSPFIRYGEDPQKVIRTLEHAVKSTNPEIRYLPGWQSRFIFYPLSRLPVWLVDQMISLKLGGIPSGLKYQQC